MCNIFFDAMIRIGRGLHMQSSYLAQANLAVSKRSFSSASKEYVVWLVHALSILSHRSVWSQLYRCVPHNGVRQWAAPHTPKNSPGGIGLS